MKFSTWPLLLLMWGSMSEAQQQGAASSWLLNWSPLARIADLPRGSAHVAATNNSLLEPVPRVGIFWSGRNPAGLPWETGARYGEARLSAEGADGDFRRPLDPAARSARDLSLLGWQNVSERGGVAGHVQFQEVTLDAGLNPATLEPSGSSPFLTSDTALSGLRATRMRLEGAGGWRIGHFGIGLAAGYDAVDANGFSTRVPRQSRTSQPAATLGIAHDFPGPALRVGAYARWRRHAETVQMLPSPGSSRVTRINGYMAPVVNIVAPSETGPYYLRREAQSRAAGLNASGIVRGWAWSLNGEAGAVEDDQWLEFAQAPPKDTWSATALDLHAAVQGTVGEALRLTAEARGFRLNGDANAADPDTIFFSATETQSEALVELRHERQGQPLHLAGRVSVTLETRDRGGTADVSVRTQIDSRALRLGLDAGYDVRSDVMIAGGYTLTSLATRGGVPRPVHYPPDIRQLVAQEVAFDATSGRTHALNLGLLWQARRATALRLNSFVQSAKPGRQAVVLEHTPEGKRTQWGVTFAVVLGPRS